LAKVFEGKIRVFFLLRRKDRGGMPLCVPDSGKDLRYSGEDLGYSRKDLGYSGEALRCGRKDLGCSGEDLV
jgi:hypothetical protein